MEGRPCSSKTEMQRVNEFPVSWFSSEEMPILLYLLLIRILDFASAKADSQWASTRDEWLPERYPYAYLSCMSQTSSLSIHEGTLTSAKNHATQTYKKNISENVKSFVLEFWRLLSCLDISATDASKSDVITPSCPLHCIQCCEN